MANEKECYIPENLPDELLDMILTAKQQVMLNKIYKDTSKKNKENFKQDTIKMCSESNKTLSEWYEIWRNSLLANMVMDEEFTEEEFNHFYDYIMKR